MTQRTAILMAGGRGSRLAPETDGVPKPLLPLGGLPVLEILLRQLEAAGFTNTVVALHHQAEDIQRFLDHRPPGSMPIHTHVEATPRGPLGALHDLQDLPRSFLVIHADLLTDLPFAEVLDAHVADPASARVVVGRVEVSFPYGVVEADEHGHVRAFREKPTIARRTSLGVFALDRDLLTHLTPTGMVGFDELAARALAAGETLATHAFDGPWFDIGTPERYAAAAAAMERTPSRFLPHGLRR